MPNILTHFIENLEWASRRLRLNRQSGISISPINAYVARTARLQLTGDGFISGGQIHICANTRISDGVILSAYGGRIFIDENVFVGPYCVLYGHGGLTIGRNTLIAAHTVIIPAEHGFSGSNELIRNQPLRKEGITIGDNVWIGCGVRILDGVVVGEGSVIGAGAVLTRSIENNSVAVGVPAKVICNRFG